MALKAVIFDLDGTLSDTHWMHAQAFEEAFRKYGYGVTSARIAPKVGEGGDRLVPQLIGGDADAVHGDGIRDAQGERYLELVAERGAPLRPGAVALIEALEERGLRTAIATGSKQDALDQVMRHADEDLSDLVDEVVTDADVENTKPARDTVTAALDQLGVAPEQVFMIGDTPFDAEAAGRAGVRCIAVRAGVYDDDALLEAGMLAVYDDPADLLAHLDEVLDLVREAGRPVRKGH